MIWRQGYTTRFLFDVELPVISRAFSSVELERPVMIAGSFGTDSIVDQGVWWRLFRSDFSESESRFLCFVEESKNSIDQDEIEAIVPASDQMRVRLIQDFGQEIHKSLSPETSQRGFAAVLHRGEIPVLMVGPPTEEAWDFFSETVQNHLV